MKKFFSAVVFLSMHCLASAQSGQLDSLAFILPQFGQGLVVYESGEYSRGTFNISPLGQTVYCITEGKDTVTVAGNAAIRSAIIDNRNFTKWKNAFVETILSDEVSGTGIGVSRTTTKVNNVQSGAYGMMDPTSSIKSLSYDNNSRQFTLNIIDNPLNFRYKKELCLVLNGKYFPVTKKNFEKLFPARKAHIESVWDERNINVADIEEVTAFYRELVEQQ